MAEQIVKLSSSFINYFYQWLDQFHHWELTVVQSKSNVAYLFNIPNQLQIILSMALVYY